MDAHAAVSIVAEVLYLHHRGLKGHEMLKKLHHSASRCRDAEETRRFYEDFLGLRLAEAKPIEETMTGRPVQLMHLFFELGDGSYLAFFDYPDEPFEFKEQHDYDLHMALEVDPSELEPWKRKAEEAGMEVRGITDHECMHSIYLRDPNGYVVELTAKVPGHDAMMNPVLNGARAKLAAWQRRKLENAAE
jgi:catechol 2,3-dioxygenase-like lactoylglutathione lyase family enzyme